MAALAYVTFTAIVVRLLPEGSYWLFACMIAVGIAFSLVSFRLPDPDEPGAVSPMPVWQKAPLVFCIAVLLYSLKNVLLAAMTTFPYLGVFAVFALEWWRGDGETSTDEGDRDE